MKILHYSIIITIGMVVVTMSSFNDTFAQNVTTSSNVIPPIPSAILRSPMPTLLPSENKSVVHVALSIPELQNWSHDWKYVGMGFGSNNKVGIAGGFEWQYVIVDLKAPSSSAPIPCDDDWWAWIEIDMTTMKVIQATYPTMESHNCDKETLGGGPGTSSVIVPVAESPLKQFKSGIAANDVQCILGFELILKTEYGSPACVELENAQKFVDSGWAKQIIFNVLNSGTIVTIPVNSSISTNGLTFSPSPVKVVTGVNNTVEWINMDSVMNDITSNTGFFKTELVSPGHAWAYLFNKTGTYEYHSKIHPWLKGTIIVLSQSNSTYTLAGK